MSQPNLRGPIRLAVLAAVVTIGMKSTAYQITGSVGLFSDALESGINLLAALTAYFSLWYSSRPADPNHTYGHEKIEFFSSGLEGVLVGVAGVGTVVYAVQHLIRPEPLGQLGLGSAIAIAASVINLVVAQILLRVGRRHGSMVLEADGHHLMTDVWTSVAVVLGLLLVSVTEIQQLDALLALAATQRANATPRPDSPSTADGCGLSLAAHTASGAAEVCGFSPTGGWLDERARRTWDCPRGRRPVAKSVTRTRSDNSHRAD